MVQGVLRGVEYIEINYRHTMMDENFKNIIKEMISQCFWDYDIDEKDVLRILCGDNPEELKYLFNKILVNGSDLKFFTSLFSEEQLSGLLKSIELNRISNERVKERVLILKNIFAGGNYVVPRLKWGRGNNRAL